MRLKGKNFIVTGAEGGNGRALALDLVEYDIRVKALTPGLTNTGMTQIDTKAGCAFRQKRLTRIPMGRAAEPEEMVGSTLVVDGGYLAA